jgi:hypothetical protein
MTERVKNELLAAAVLLLVAGGMGKIDTLVDAAIFAAVVATIAQWHRLPRMPRIFVSTALIVGPTVAMAFPQAIPELKAALAQGVAFAVLLSTIGMMRQAVRRSVIAAEAARYLVSVPGRGRYAAINVGSHFLSLLFNVGIIALIGELLHGDRRPMSEPTHRHLLLAGMRGTVLMTVWSPMGLGFAIVTTGIVGLDPVRFLILSFLAATLILGVTCFVFGEPRDDDAAPEPDGARPDETRRSVRPVVALFGVSGLMLGATVLLHEVVGASFVVATAAVIPVFALSWLAIERVDDGRRHADHLGGMFAGLSDLRGESAIFLSANVIGAAISVVLRAQPFWSLFEAAGWPDWWTIAGCLVILPIAGALMIPHSIFVVLIVQLFGHGSVAVDHPMTMALALTLGWAMAIAVSPISAVSLITGHLSGVPSHVVGLSWNARFVSTLLVLSAGLVFVAYRLGW